MIPAASRSNCFSMPFCKPLPTPNKMTRIKIPDATEIPVRNVLSLFLAIASKISCQRSMLNMCRCPNLFYYFIVNDESVLEYHIAFAHRCNIGFMRYNEDRFAVVINALNQLHYFI